MCLPPDHLRPLSEENALRKIARPHSKVSIRLTLKESPKRSSRLLEVFHLFQLPPELPPTESSKLETAVSNIRRKQPTFSGFGCHKL
jgi:hypothetical protein